MAVPKFSKVRPERNSWYVVLATLPPIVSLPAAAISVTPLPLIVPPVQPSEPSIVSVPDPVIVPLVKLSSPEEVTLPAISSVAPVMSIVPGPARVVPSSRVSVSPGVIALPLAAEIAGDAVPANVPPLSNWSVADCVETVPAPDWLKTTGRRCSLANLAYPRAAGVGEGPLVIDRSGGGGTPLAQISVSLIRLKLASGSLRGCPRN